MMSIQSTWFSIQSRPRVIHRIPGRIRIHIPVIRQVTAEFQNISSHLLKKINLPEGIISTNINYITGNVLVHYNADSIYENEVLTWIQDLKKIAFDISSRFESLSDSEARVRGRQLLKYFKQISKNGNILDKHFKIPDHVWS